MASACRARTRLKKPGFSRSDLQAKEGLALLNGTQAMHAVGGLALFRAKRLARVADVAGAMTLEALKGTPVAFDERIHNARPHPGQRRSRAISSRFCAKAKSASRTRRTIRESRMPTVCAACRRCTARSAVRSRIARRFWQSNPARRRTTRSFSPTTATSFPAAIFTARRSPLRSITRRSRLTDLMSISERRIDRLTNPDLNEGLPAFLAQHPGMQSGFMIAHVAAVALLNEAKVLAHPASVDNLPTSAGKEDHVSMGMTGALKLRTIVENAENVLAIELLAAGEGLEFRRPLKAGVGVERAFATLRGIAPRVDEDRALSTDIERVAEAIRDGQFDSADDRL